MLGDLLDGRYELRRVLGDGTKPRVYEAWDTTLRQRVAVKLLDERAVDNQALVERFAREARALTRLAHPNIVTVYGAGHDRGVRYVVVELIDGRDLGELLRDGPLPPERAATIAADVCLALDHAHKHGIVHRDIKPANILLTANDEVKVTDFGLAEVAALPRRTGVDPAFGTVEYVAPERAAGGTVDARADLYALGCCLYEMLTGAPPFGRVGDPDGGGELTALTIARRHRHHPPAPLPSLRPDVPAGLDRTVLKALAKQPGARQQTAEEFHRDLDRFSRRPGGAPVASTATPLAGAGAGGADGPGDLLDLGPGERAGQEAEVALASGGAVPDDLPDTGPGGSGAGGAVPPAPLAAGTTPGTAPGAAPPDDLLDDLPGHLPGHLPGDLEEAKAQATAADGPERPAPREEQVPVPARVARRPAAARRRARLASLVVLTLGASGVIVALAPGGGDEDALRTPLGLEASPAPTTLAATTTTAAPATTGATTTTTAAPTTTAPTTTAAPATTAVAAAPDAATTTSAAAEARQVVVPELVGQDGDDAAEELAELGLDGHVEEVSTGRLSRLDTVVDQEPAAGTPVRPGTTVTLVVATRFNLLAGLTGGG